MHDLKWRSCGHDACVSVPVAKQSVTDRLNVAKWMGEANDLIDYYERVTEPAPAATDLPTVIPPK